MRASFFFGEFKMYKISVGVSSDFTLVKLCHCFSTSYTYQLRVRRLNRLHHGLKDFLRQQYSLMHRSELIPYWSRMDCTGPYFVHVLKMVPYCCRLDVRHRCGGDAGSMPDTSKGRRCVAVSTAIFYKTSIRQQCRISSDRGINLKALQLKTTMTT